MRPRILNGMAVLDVRGSLTGGATGANGSLGAAVARLARAGEPRIGVNLAGVTNLDAGGLGELVRAWHAARDHGRRLTLVAPPPRVRRMLAITRIDTVIDVHESFGSFGRSGRSDRSAGSGRSGAQFLSLRSSSNQLSTT